MAAAEMPDEINAEGMNNLAQDPDPNMITLLEIMAQKGIRHAAQGLSSMIGEELNVSEPAMRVVPLGEIAVILGGPENEAVGIYLRSEGMLAGQFMLITPYPKALELVDLIMDVPEGSTTNLGSLERSALAEVGNMTVAFFLNAIDRSIGMAARPTPPAVIVDMVGAILDVIIATCGGISEHVLLLETNISRGDRGIDLVFWVIPEPSTIEAFINLGK
jgi:chemotaxis protein CheC